MIIKQFYIIAHPNYFKNTMGWDMKHNDVKYSDENKLVMFVASENVPDTTETIDPYVCGFRTVPIDDNRYNYIPYIAD